MPEIGQTVSHYKIIEKLGAGGMGVVYRAEDTNLNRQVAIKVLPEMFSGDPERMARFEREAKLLASLNHPNIATIYGLEQADGKRFLVMELVEGETLAQRIAKAPLPVDEALDVCRQISEALEAAHGKGIIHRDIKPANVMLTQTGHAKVMDFGLAKQLIPSAGLESAAETVTALTSEGAIVGTLAYMSPEQLRGRTLDARSDIWALGATLYEMVAGTRPFHGQSGFELSSAILNQAPQPLPSGIPAELGAVIGHCLEKDAAKRYQQAGELRQALSAVKAGTVPPWVAWRYRLGRRRWLAATVPALLLLLIVAALSLDWLRTRFWGGMPRVQSLAVLPLEDLSRNPEQDYFADGMTEELITDLSKISALKVTSRSATMRYKGTKKSLPEIAKELNVDGIIEGSVLREGDQVRITAHLINAGTQQDIWADSYQRNMKSVLALQSEIASTVASKVQAALTPEEKSRLASARAVNPQAYENYLKGKAYLYKETKQDLDTAMGYFQLAKKEDPSSALAYVGIAMVWGHREQFGFAPSTEASSKRMEAANKAMELDPSLPEVHFLLAQTKAWTNWDWTGAEVEYKKAIELNPNFGDARAYYSHLLMAMGRPNEGMQQIEWALELDPSNGLYRIIYGVDLLWTRRYDDAITQAKLALQMSPRIPVAENILWGSYFARGMEKEALSAERVRVSRFPESGAERALEKGYAEGGYRLAMRRVGDALAAYSHKSHVGPGAVAVYYLQSGDKPKALDWLEEAFRQHDPSMPYIGLPMYDILRSDPRFQDLVRRMNLPQ